MKGLRVGVTATRKSTQLTTALARQGAHVVSGPMLSGDVPAPDDQILADTATVLAERPGWVVATSAVGMRLWLEAADRGGVGDDLRDLLRGARGVARGAKPVAGFVAAGTQPFWVSEQGTDRDVADWLSEHAGPGERIAVQLHGGRTHAYRHLHGAGLDVLTVLPYTSARPHDEEPARRLIHRLVDGDLDVVTFTSPSAARNLFEIARDLGEDVLEAVRTRLTGPVAVASIGPVTSEALEAWGAVVAITPRRHRTGDLVRSIERWAADGRGPADDDRAPVARLRPGAREVVVGGRAVRLSPREYDILATMLRSRGDVFRAEEFGILAWGHRAPTDATTVRHHVARLRRKLAATGLRIETVRGVGYRISERPARPVARC